MYPDDTIIPQDEFLALMERDKHKNYAKGAAALIGVVLMIAFLLVAITQLAVDASVFTN